MTTAFLAQKLVTLRLDRSEFEKLRWRKIDNTLRKQKVTRYLKKILEKDISNKTCRLCLKPGGRTIYSKEWQSNVAQNIKIILGIEVAENDGKPQHICASCECTLNNAVLLKQTAEVTQWRLEQELEMVAGPELDLNEDESNKKNDGYFCMEGREMKRVWTCHKCKKLFHKQEDFNEHESLPSCKGKQQSYMCEYCGKEMKCMALLNRHRLSHNGKLQYACTRCPHRSNSQYALRMHERLHTGVRPLCCDLCPATFANPSNLISHKRRHFPPQFPCEHCSKRFKHKENLHNHIATQHSSVKPYVCSFCGKAYATRKMIRRHELVAHNRPKMRRGTLPLYLRRQQEENDT